MRPISLALTLAMFALFISSGCLSYRSADMNATGRVSEGEAQVRAVVLEKAEFSLVDLSTDRELYHSAEVMNLSVTIYSMTGLEGVRLTAKGVKNKLDMIKTVNLSAGTNRFDFIYKLPSCNTCGGIGAGTYDIQCEVSHNNITVKNTTYVELRQ